MPSTREIKRRIGSIKNIGQITKAMQMVATSKMRRAQDRVQQARPYAEQLRGMVSRLARAGGADIGAGAALMAERPVRKIGYIDLMKIADPDGKAKKGTKDGVFTFPFFTIENVDVVDRANGVIVVGNDNNLPFSSSRDPKKADDNELVLLSVKELLDAK